VEAEGTSLSINANEKRSRKRFQADPSWKRQRCPKWHADRGCPGPVALWRAGFAVGWGEACVGARQRRWASDVGVGHANNRAQKKATMAAGGLEGRLWDSMEAGLEVSQQGGAQLGRGRRVVRCASLQPSNTAYIGLRAALARCAGQ